MRFNDEKGKESGVIVEIYRKSKENTSIDKIGVNKISSKNRKNEKKIE